MLVILFSTAGCSPRRAERFQWDPPEFRVKGTYYFQPRAAVNNFWTSLDWEKSKTHFAQLREDGFNTIILFIPWGLFQPTVRPITYNEQAFAELDRLFQIADSFGLKVVLRVGTHDHIPRDATGGKWLAGTVLVNDEEWAAYRDLFRELAVRTKSHSNLLFFFWTFEDTGYPPDLWFHQYPANVASFRQWLHRRPLWWWNLIWREKNASYETVEPPNQNREPLNAMKLRTFLDFSDELVARRLPEACAAAKEGNPDVVVSFQPRPEVNWRHDYSLQFELPPCYSFVTTWFSPYQSYLFGDERKELDGKTTASYVPRYLERTEKLSNGLPVFVDQFNFQHFGGHPEEGALQTAKEQLDFVAYSLPVLLQDSLGYALWNYSDYYLNVVSDGFFRFGFQEWETPSDSERVKVLPTGNRENPEVEIQPGGFVRQNISVYPETEYTLEFLARSAKASTRGHVLIRFQPADRFLDLSVPLNSRTNLFSLKVKIPPDSNTISMMFFPQEGGAAIRIQEILFYPWIDTGGVYDAEGQPRTELRDVFRRFNNSVRH
ncbi:MAG: beta-galactosidase [Acidobacteria bacterium]|nr:beta-galactosidase [Acidobacteriota bacterium]